ncbi:hypothetical protein KGF57_002278 [Candida theae]|uniref:Uncharacterized protein n=1 Tax=Candida theae TaxID=1198502 RepID=A0AAD5BFB3_9ASCO|nr:uncharacterized protein KGF57_002278 [Candida theae]KAI5958844.1 hypothetical protein KGF57_002278 [Candida theae]
MLIKYVTLLLYIQLGFTLLIPHVLKPRIFSLRSTKQRLQATINPLVPTRKFKKDFSIFSSTDESGSGAEEGYVNNTSANLTANNNFVIIPKELINPTMFSTLGLNKLFDLVDDFHSEHGGSKWMNFSLEEQIYIPHEFKTYFIFNTSSIKQSMGLDTIRQKQQQQQQQQQQEQQQQQQPFSSHTLNKFLSHIVPFDIPELVELVDYYMVLPNLPHLSNLTSSIYHEGLLSYPMSQLPVFRTQMSHNKPLIVFMFNETDGANSLINDASVSPSKHQHNQHKLDPSSKSTTQIMSIKNYLKSPAPFSTFFDKFARNWINQVDYDSLIHSVFCNVNSQDEDHSFCLRLRNQVVDVVPAFKKFVAMSDPNVVADTVASQLKQNEKSYSASLSNNLSDNHDDITVQSQAVRQVHDKLQAKKHALTMAGTTGVNLIRDPKHVLHKLDDYIDNKLDDQMDKLGNKKYEIAESLDDKKEAVLISLDSKKSSAFDSVRDAMSDKKSALFDEFDVAVEGGKFVSLIDDKRQQVSDLIQRKKNDLQEWEFKPQLFEKKKEKSQDKNNSNKGQGVIDKLKSKLSRDGSDDDDYDSDYDHPALYSDHSDGEDRYDKHSDDGKEYVNKRSMNSIDDTRLDSSRERDLHDASIQPGVGDYIEQGGFSLPLSLLNYKGPSNNNANTALFDTDDVVNEIESNNQPPRKTTYSQVMNLDTMSPMNQKRSSDEEEKEPCQPITWYNIFHHSVFGEPNFCKE